METLILNMVPNPYQEATVTLTPPRDTSALEILEQTFVSGVHLWIPWNGKLEADGLA